MKIPLDYICVKTGVLCPRCRKLVESGVVSEFEVDLMRLLIDLESDPEFKNFLNNFTYVKAYKISDTIVILGEYPQRSDQRIIQRISKILGDRLNAKVRIISAGAKKDIKSIVSQLVFPARIIGVNIVWLPDGSHQYVVRIPRTDLRYMPMSSDNVEKLIEMISGESVRIKIE
ncbi:MAG: transcription elongation factor NusA [Sulfolobales archaeon]